MVDADKLDGLKELFRQQLPYEGELVASVDAEVQDSCFRLDIGKLQGVEVGREKGGLFVFVDGGEAGAGAVLLGPLFGVLLMKGVRFKFLKTENDSFIGGDFGCQHAAVEVCGQVEP